MTTRASASRYARALLEAIVPDGNPEQVEHDLTAFADLVSRSSELQRTFANPAVPVSAKRRIVEKLLSPLQISSPTANLLLLFAERDRLALVGEMAKAYRERLMEYRQVARAEVTTAAPLAPDQVAQMQQQLAAVTGRRLTLTTRVDPALIGGAVARVGSVVYDSSIATQLQKLRERLEERR
jgi:F-type H+-transporting ATPase subunit delta